MTSTFALLMPAPMENVCTPTRFAMTTMIARPMPATPPWVAPTLLYPVARISAKAWIAMITAYARGIYAPAVTV